MRNARSTSRNHYELIAVLLINSKEGKESTLLGLKSSFDERADKGKSLSNYWIVDGGPGFRQAIVALYQDTPWLDAELLRIAMCWFHVVAAVYLWKGKVPNYHQFIHEFYILAGCPIALHDKTMGLLDSTWRSRGKDWVPIADYVKKTWIQDLPGWWSGYLPEGHPRVSFEGTWPGFHNLIGIGKYDRLALAKVIAHRFVPYIAHTGKRYRNPSTISLVDRRAAVELALLGADKLQVMGDEIVFKRRILGMGRPQCTLRDVELYENALRVFFAFPSSSYFILPSSFFFLLRLFIPAYIDIFRKST
jgi:hypothetical protein